MSWFKTRRILVPFDFSVQSASAVGVAVELAQSNEDVHVLHVLPNLIVTEPGVIWDSVDDEKRKTDARSAMEKQLNSTDSRGVQIDVGIGDPGHVIADLAEEIGAGLIVIPSHGRTGVTRILMGSVAERVVRLAHCPVLVLKH